MDTVYDHVHSVCMLKRARLALGCLTGCVLLVCQPSKITGLQHPSHTVL